MVHCFSTLCFSLNFLYIAYLTDDSLIVDRKNTLVCRKYSAQKPGVIIIIKTFKVVVFLFITVASMYFDICLCWKKNKLKGLLKT